MSPIKGGSVHGGGGHDHEDLPPDQSTDCQSAECQKAKNDLITLKNELIIKCGQIKSKQSQITESEIAIAVSSALAAAYVTAASIAAGTVVGIPAALVLLGLAALALAAVIASTLSLIVFQVELSHLKGDYSDMQNSWNKFVKTIQQFCPEDCRGDLTIPTCNY